MVTWDPLPWTDRHTWLKTSPYNFVGDGSKCNVYVLPEKYIRKRVFFPFDLVDLAKLSKLEILKYPSLHLLLKIIIIISMKGLLVVWTHQVVVWRFYDFRPHTRWYCRKWHHIARQKDQSHIPNGLQALDCTLYKNRNCNLSQASWLNMLNTN